MNMQSTQGSSRHWATKTTAVLVAALGAIPALAVDRTAVATDQSLTFPRCPLGPKGPASDPCRVPPPPLPRIPL